MSRSFLNSGTLIVILAVVLLGPQHQILGFFLICVIWEASNKKLSFSEKKIFRRTQNKQNVSRSRKCSEFSSQPFRGRQKSSESRFAPFTEEKIARNKALNPSWKSNINGEASKSSNATATGTPTRVWTLATTETKSTDDFFGLWIVKVAF
jgi:hypothetical protein